MLRAIARSVNGEHPSVDLEPWEAMSRLLGERMQVKVPFAEFLAEKVSIATLRVRRDFTHLLTLVQASAVEHSFQRPSVPDGVLMATLADYAHVHALAADAFQAAQEEGITPADREMAAVVEELSTPEEGEAGDTPVSQAAICRHLKLSKSVVSYRVRRLLRLGYLSNLETAKGRPHMLVLGSPLPDQVPPLPDPCDMAKYLLEAGRPELVDPWVDPMTGQAHNCWEHLGDGADFDSSHPVPTRTLLSLQSYPRI